MVSFIQNHSRYNLIKENSEFNQLTEVFERNIKQILDNWEFFFLNTSWQNKKRHSCCQICKDLDFTESSIKEPRLPPVPARVPTMMALFAAFGIFLMIAGFAYVMMVAPQQDSSILHVIIGSCMSGAGFMLARKMVKIRNIILGKTTINKMEKLR